MAIDPLRFYQSPPGSGSNDGATPSVYNPKWQLFRNLSPNQIAWFSSQPQFLIFYAGDLRFKKEVGSLGPQLTVGGIPISTDDRTLSFINGLAIAATRDQQNNPSATYSFAANGQAYTITVVQALALFDGTRAYLHDIRATEAQMVSGINGATITSTAQIDAAYAGIVVVK